VAFGNPQDFIDRRDPLAQEGFFAKQGPEGLVQGSMQPLSLVEECIGALRVILGESEELSTAFRGNDSRNVKKTEKFIPREVGGRPEFVGEIKGELTADEFYAC
jgi:hypothetical protein